MNRKEGKNAGRTLWMNKDSNINSNTSTSNTQTQNGSIQRVESRTSKWEEYRNTEHPGIKLKPKWI